MISEKLKAMKKIKKNYKESLDELQKIVEKIENPDTDLQEISKYVKRASELVRQCQEQLRAIEEDIPDIT